MLRLLPGCCPALKKTADSRGHRTPKKKRPLTGLPLAGVQKINLGTSLRVSHLRRTQAANGRTTTTTRTSHAVLHRIDDFRNHLVKDHITRKSNSDQAFFAVTFIAVQPFVRLKCWRADNAP